MNLTELSFKNKGFVITQGIDLCYMDQHYILYYDETNNVKKFRVRENGFNVDSESIFVLGGIEGKGELSFDELKEYIGIKQPNLIEIKSKHIYEGDFENTLKSHRLERVLDLLEEKQWHVHFHSLNLLYYSLVDIIESIDAVKSCLQYVYGLKSLLYRIIKTNISEIVRIYNKYDYPNLKDQTAICDFLSDIHKMCSDYADVCPMEYKGLLTLLLYLLSQAMTQDSMIFIQDETPKELLSGLQMNYVTELTLFINSQFVFDNENDIVENMKDGYSINGVVLSNYKFVDSRSSTMVQLSDVLVGIIARYMKVIDRYGMSFEARVLQFDEMQLRVFRKLNKILYKSILYNPLFVHQIDSIDNNHVYTTLLNKYGK